MAYIDFAALKAAVSIDKVADWLQFDLKKKPNGQLRGCCPIHGGTNDREFVITPSKGLFNCFGPCGGGDAINLAAHFLKIGTREAAERIAQHFNFGRGTSEPSTPGGATVPATTTPSGPKSGSDDLSSKLAKVREKLLYEHEAIQAIGLTPEVARAFDIGYCPSGIMRGRIVSPMYHDGVHVAYKGLATTAEQSPLMLFPANLADIVAAPKQEKPEPNDVRNFLRVIK